MPRDENRASSQAPPREIKLAFLSQGSARAIYHVIADGLTIGRGSPNKIPLEDPRASKRHVELTCYGRDYVLHDLDSMNGTRVNEHAIKTHVLLRGDIVRVGRSVFLCLGDGNPVVRDPHHAMGWIVGSLPRGQSVTLPVTETPILIGAAEDNDIHVPRPAPDYIAQIVAVPNGEQLTRLDGEKPVCGWLEDGRKMTFGPVSLEYRISIKPKAKPGPATTRKPGAGSPAPAGRLSIQLGPDAANELALRGAIEEEAERVERELVASAPTKKADAKASRPHISLHRTGGCMVTALSGPSRGVTFAVSDKPVLMGSEKACDVCMKDPNVSTRHARLQRVAGDVMIEDLGGERGVYVNDQRVRRKPLRPGDHIRLGETEFLVHL